MVSISSLLFTEVECGLVEVWAGLGLTMEVALQFASALAINLAVLNTQFTNFKVLFIKLVIHFTVILK